MAKKTIQVADKPTLDTVKSLVDSIVDNSSSGCAAILTPISGKIKLYLFAGNKIYCNHTMTAVSNCTKSTDNLLTVTSNGIVEFGVNTTDQTVIISIA